MSMRTTGTFNRIEVIDHTDTGKEFDRRAFMKWIDENMVVELSEQDEGRTLKIFLRNLGSTDHCPGCGAPGFKIGAPVSVCNECGWCE